MDILQVLLRSCNSEKYYNNFKENGIGSHDLNLLVEEDLSVIGIDDEECRKKIMKFLKGSQIPSDRKISLIVDNRYTQLVLAQISQQLNRHLAMLTYSLNREDTNLCNIVLSPSVHCLLNILQDFEENLDVFEYQVTKNKRTKSKKLLFIIPTILIGSLAMLAYCKKNI